jgi:type IV pilus assembly protein PilN
MIRINLLGQARPKAAKKAVPLEATVQIIFLLLALAISAVVLGVTYVSQKKQLDTVNSRITQLNAEKTRLQQIKQEVNQFDSQKSILQQRIGVIETLQKNRTGAQELLQQVANTVVRIDSLWLTSLERKGEALEIQGEAGSINAVANFITELRRSGYFGKVEIKEAKEDDLARGATTYNFQMSAAISPSPSPAGQPQPQKTAAAPAPAQQKGRS